MNTLTIGKAKDSAVESLRSMVEHYVRLSKNYEVGSDVWFNLMIKVNELQQKITTLGNSCEVV